MTVIEELRDKIIKLKTKLHRTDYKAIKYAEGVLSYAEYSDTLMQRQAWRDEINKLEIELETELMLLKGK